MPISFNCLQRGKGCRASAIAPRQCAQCSVELHIPIESKACHSPRCPDCPSRTRRDRTCFNSSSGQSPWLITVLILLVGVGVAWFLGKKGLLGGDEADHASSANASLMHLRKAMRLADAGSHAEAEVEFARAITLATAPGAEAWRAVSDAQAATLMRGEARFSHGELRGAEEDFSKVIALAGTQPSYRRPTAPAMGMTTSSSLFSSSPGEDSKGRSWRGPERSQERSQPRFLSILNSACSGQSTNQQSQQIIRRLVGVFGTGKEKRTVITTLFAGTRKCCSAIILRP